MKIVGKETRSIPGKGRRGDREWEFAVRHVILCVQFDEHVPAAICIEAIDEGVSDEELARIGNPLRSIHQAKPYFPLLEADLTRLGLVYSDASL